MLDGAHAPPDFLRDDHGVRGLGERVRELLDRRRLRRGDLRVGRGRGVGRHRLEHVLHRDGDEHGALRRGHRELTGAGDGRGQERARVQAVAPLDRVRGQLRRAADVREHPEPLVTRIGTRHLAEADRFAGEHDHRHTLVQRGPKRHGRVLHADRGVDHHGRELARHLGVAAGHRHGDLLVPRREVRRDRPGLVGLGEVLPHRRPL